MTDPARAARLTAIREKFDHRRGPDVTGDSPDYYAHDDDIDFLLAHVETLTQQVAELTAGRVPCKICDGKDDAAAENAECYNCRQKPYRDLEAAEQENARLRIWFDEKAHERLQQAELARDAAHAALRQIKTIVRPWIDYISGTKSPRVSAEEWLAACDMVDAALAASAPQKEQK